MGSPHSTAARWRVVASEKSWIETKAVDQLAQTTAALDLDTAVGMPDLHPGKGVPNGAAYLHRDRVFPHLIGEDIGCGYAFARLDGEARKLPLEKAVERLAATEVAARARREDARAATGAMRLDDFEHQLGTVGGGNHFAELQALETDAEDVGEAGDLFVLVHSGSRGLGGRAFHTQLGVSGARGVDPNAAEGRWFLAAHDVCVAWAKANRLALATAMADRLRLDAAPLFDVAHNLVERRDEGWLHRKGVQPADAPLLVVPGSRGAATHLVRPTAGAEALWSIAHGAGRKWARADVRGRLGGRKASDLRRIEGGARVICGERALLFEEAPEAYKSIDQVVGDLVAEGLVERVARLRPLITFKSAPAEVDEERRARRDVKRRRKEARR